MNVLSLPTMSTTSKEVIKSECEIIIMNIILNKQDLNEAMYKALREDGYGEKEKIELSP